MSRKQLCTVPMESDAKPVFGTGTPGLLEMRRLLLGDRQEYYRRTLERFDEVTFIKLFGNKVVLFLTPAGAQAVAMNLDKALANGPAWGTFIGLGFRRGILLLDFDEHRLHRSVMQGAFSSPNLKGYLQEMQPMLAERVVNLSAGQGRLGPTLKGVSLCMAMGGVVGVKLPPGETDPLIKGLIGFLASVGAPVFLPNPRR